MSLLLPSCLIHLLLKLKCDFFLSKFLAAKILKIFIFDFFYGNFGSKHPFIIMRYFCHQNLKLTKFIKALKKLETTLFLLLVLFSCTSRSYSL